MILDACASCSAGGDAIAPAVSFLGGLLAALGGLFAAAAGGPAGGGDGGGDASAASSAPGASSGDATAPDGAGVRVDRDGTATTSFPDGTRTTAHGAPPPGPTVLTAPDGTVTRFDPDGHTSTVIPGIGTLETKPGATRLTTGDEVISSGDDGEFLIERRDGSRASGRADGVIVTDDGRGTRVETKPTGETRTTLPDQTVVKEGGGTRWQENPDGTRVITTPNGEVTTVAQDGSRQTVRPGTIASRSVSADGRTIVSIGENGDRLDSHPDGSSVYTGHDGEVRVRDADGTIRVVSGPTRPPDP